MRAEPTPLDFVRESPAPSVSHQATEALLAAADRVRQILSSPLQRRGVTLAQYNVLRILRDAPAEGVPTIEAGQRLIEHAPGITRMMDRLVKRGWVMRRRSTSDRRQILCALSAEGRSLVDALEHPMAEAVVRGMAALDGAQQRQLLHLLEWTGGQSIT